MLQGVGRTSPPGPQNLLYSSLPKPPPSAQITRRTTTSCLQPGDTLCISVCKSCCDLLPGCACSHALCQPQLQKTKRPRILVDGNGCRNAFLWFFSTMMKGPGLAGAGTEAVCCSFSWAEGLPQTERPLRFLHCLYRGQ